MKHKKLITGLFLALGVTVSTLFLPIIAQAENYTYTVKVYVGGTPEANWTFKDAQGGELSTDKKCITYKGLTNASSIPFNPQEAVDLPDDNVKYGVKGIRRTGEDSLANNVISVNADETYVVAYEFGKLVPYTVQFLNESGAKIIPDAEFYGVEGKSLKVGVKYLNNYTGIVSADDYVDALESGHVFKFVYTDNPNTETIYNTTGGGTSYSTVTGSPEYVYQTIPGQPVPLAGEGVTNNRGEGGGNAGGAGAGGAGGAGEAVEGGEAGDTTQIGEAEVPLGGDDNTITVPEPEPPKGVDDVVKKNYIRYLIIIAIIGLMVVLTAIIGTFKLERDKNRRN